MSKARSGGLEPPKKRLPSKRLPLVEEERRRQECVRMRMEGAGWQRIAMVLGYSDWRAARQSYNTYLNEAVHAPERERERRHELVRLEHLLDDAMAEFTRLRAADSDVERVVARVLSLHSAKVKLLGLQAPVEEAVHQTHSVTDVRIVSGPPSEYVHGLLQLEGRTAGEIIEAMHELETGAAPQLSEEQRLAHIDRNRPPEKPEEGDDDDVAGQG